MLHTGISACTCVTGVTGSFVITGIILSQFTEGFYVLFYYFYFSALMVVTTQHYANMNFFIWFINKQT